METKEGLPMKKMLETRGNMRSNLDYLFKLTAM